MSCLDRTEFCDWIQRPSKYSTEPPTFDEVAIAEQELSILESRLRRQEAFIRGDGCAELSTDPSPATAVISDLVWDHAVEKSQLRLVQTG